MNSLPAYMSITGGGRLGKKMVQEQLCLRLQPGFSDARQSAAAKEKLACGTQNAHRIIYDEAGCMSTYALWSGFSKLGAKFIQGTIKPKKKRKKSTYKVFGQVLVFVIYT